MASRRTVGVEVEEPSPEIQDAMNGVLADNDDSPYRLVPDSMDPSLHYRFVALNDSRLTKLFATRGYRFVNRFTDSVRVLQADFLPNKPKEDEDPLTADTRVIIGGMVLVCCPRELYEKRRSNIEAMTKLRLRTEVQKDKLREALTEQQELTIITEGGPS